MLFLNDMAGRIPQHFIDDLMSRTDIVEVISSHIPLKKAGKEYKACCPFHDEKTPSFTVSPAKQFYHCFGCGAHGTVVGFLMEHDRAGFVEAIEDLASRAGVEVPREQGTGPDRSRDELFELSENVARYYQNCLKKDASAIAYLKQRGLTGETAKTFGIGYAPARWDALVKKFGQTDKGRRNLLAAGLIIEGEKERTYDRFRHRIMFPIRDTRGRAAGFGGRVIDDSNPKYMNSPETTLFHKGSELFGLYEARRAVKTITRLLVVEGYMDVVALAEHGIHNVVATLGTATTSDQLHQMFRVTDEIVFCFDGDDAGRKAAWKALQTSLPEIRGGRQVRFLFLPEGHDPDSLVNEIGKEAFVAKLADSIALSDFLVARLATGVDLESVDGRARLAELATPLVNRIPQGIFLDLLIEHLAETVRMPAARLAGLIRRPGNEPTPGLTAPVSVHDSSFRGSLVRRAIALLVHYPRAASEDVDITALKQVDRPGTSLLAELLEDLRSHPQITTAGILERWRQHEDGPHLTRLAAQDMLVAEDAAALVLTETIRRLIRQAGPEKSTEDLLSKAQSGRLTPEEKLELTDLLGRDADRSATAP